MRRCLKPFSATFLGTWVLVGPLAIAELGRDPTFELLRQRQLAQEAERIERELAEPRSVTVPPDRASLGPAQAPISILVFSDFQCPYCARGAETVEAVRKKYGNKIRTTFLHFPMPMHAQARPAARYFEAIALQSAKKAYAFHDKVFADQDKLTTDREAFLDATAKAVGADMGRLKKDLESSKVTERIAADEKLAQELGFSGTPSFVVAGVALKGAYPLETFERIIDYRLKNLRRGLSKSNR